MTKIQVDSNGKAIMLGGKALVASEGGGETEGFLVKVIDYDGTVLKSEQLNTGATFTLPNEPSHSGLVFDGWSSPVIITNNTITVTDSDITIGSIFHTASGLSEFDITLTTVTGLLVTLNMDGTKNWGDGTSDTNTTHTYSSVGDYTITCAGSTMTTSSSSGLFGQTSSVKNCYVKDARLADGVTSIDDSAFSGCSSLTDITIPNGVTSIGDSAFSSCYSLKSIIIPDGVTSIDDSAFSGCSSLTDITIPNGVTSIGGYTFSSCRSLTSITIPNGVTSINTYAFINCSSLTSITIPNGVTSINTSAFYGCHLLTSITIPDGVTSIGNNAFQYCHSLTSITIPDSVTSIGNNAFSGCYSLKSIVIPDSVTSIGANTFTSCYSLKSIIISDSVTSIGDSVFYICYSLKSIVIPDSVTSIGNYTFRDCYSLTSITIPNGLTSIGDSAFQNCYPIIEYDFGNLISIPTLSNISAFAGINDTCKMYVPWDLYEDWIAATNWSSYVDYISVRNPATLNFTVTPSNSTIYVNGSQIQGTSTIWAGSTAPYIIHNFTNNVVLSNSQTGITEGTTVNITADLTSYNKITLSTNITGLNPIFTIGGVSFYATDEGNGNYSINVIGSGIKVDYTISSDNYLFISGTVTTTGSDITENITMQAVSWQTFTRPNLTADGTLGGDSFAVSASSVYASTAPAWRAVDGSTSISYYWSPNYSDSNPTYTFYNPNWLKVSQIRMTYTNNSYRASTVTIQGSNDNVNWTNLSSSYSGTTTGTLTINNDNGYKYHRLAFVRYDTFLRLAEMTITAQEGIAT